MYVLIDTDKFELLAKHPNFVTLHQLGIIICPGSQLVCPVDNLSDLEDVDLQMLYINLTNNLGAAPYERTIVERILSDYFAQLPGTVLDHAEVSQQAEFALAYDVQGYCSFQSGQVVPSMEEGLWKPLVCEYVPGREGDIVSGLRAVEHPVPLQESWTPGRGAKS